MNQFATILKTFGPARLAWIATIILGLIVFFVFIITQLTNPGMSLLYGGLDPAEATQIAQKLEGDQVPYEIRGDGTQIYVPEDQVSKLRLFIAGEGLPSGGTIGYEIFDRTDTLGSTDFVQQISQLRALEGELSRSIKSLRQIKAARVHLVIPKRELFSKDRQEPSASVLVTLKGSLEKSQISAIQHLVGAAVPGLKIGNISIIDQWGNLLARGDGASDGSASGEAAEDMRRSLEAQKAAEIEDVLSRSLGQGKVRAKVTAELDFSRSTTNTEEYNPEGQVVRSSQTVDDSENNQERNSNNAVTVGNNLPNAQQQGGNGQDTSQSQTSRSEETINYEISKSTRTLIQEGGVVKKISAAIMVDGTYETGSDGTKTFKPRTQEELDQYTKIVRSIIGYDEKRGDIVEIVNLPFAEPQDAASDNGLFLGFSQPDLVRFGQMAILGIIAILALLLVVRPLVSKLLTAVPIAENNTLALESAGLGGITPAIAGPQGGTLPGAPPPGLTNAEMARAITSAESTAQEIDNMIDLNQVEGRVRASSIKKIGDLVAQHPEVAVNIMRSWMYQDR